jgi:hypothetical protein
MAECNQGRQVEKIECRLTVTLSTNLLATEVERICTENSENPTFSPFATTWSFLQHIREAE